MKANELRIGNFICNNESDYFEVIGIHDDVLHCIDKEADRHVIHISNINPIPLTAGVLEKSGFFNTGFVFLLEIDHVFRFNNCGTKSSVYLEVCNDGDWYERVELNYLHQLQNLFFSLTQTELNI